MLYELRTYTLVPGTQAAYLRLASGRGREIRGNKYGTLEGCWTTEIGPLNQYVHLWSYADPNDRARARAGLAADEAWKAYVPEILPMMVDQRNALLYAVDGVPLTPPADGERHVYELRTYRTHPGKTAEWLANFKAALPAREKYSRIVGLWQAEVAQLNQVMHLWAYRDLVHRAEVRASALDDSEWQAFLPRSTPLLAEMHSTILNPTDFSPLR